MYKCIKTESSIFKMASSVLNCFPRVSEHKESTCNAGDLGLIPRLGRCLGEGTGYLL